MAILDAAIHSAQTGRTVAAVNSAVGEAVKSRSGILCLAVGPWKRLLHCSHCGDPLVSGQIHCTVSTSGSCSLVTPIFAVMVKL